jgi:putative tricarboxylic transport membrane protein
VIERVLALGVLVASGVYLVNGLLLPQGTAAQPGPGLYPVAVGVFGAVVAATWLLIALRRAPAGAGGVAIPQDGRRRVGVAAALLLGFCLLLPWSGYPPAAFLFTSLLLRGLGASWPAASLVGIVSAVGSYYLFGVLLGVPLPRGVLFD